MSQCMAAGPILGHCVKRRYCAGYVYHWLADVESDSVIRQSVEYLDKFTYLVVVSQRARLHLNQADLRTIEPYE
jgi:hypothetical protein